MRRFIILPFISLGLLFSVNVLAGSAQHVHQIKSIPNQSKSTLQQKQKSIILYAQPNRKKILQKLPAFTRLVVILRKGEWAKVGNPNDGVVGWINIKQWRDAQHQSFQASSATQSVYIDRQGDKLVVYKNGKKLPHKEAEQVYKHWQAQQLKQQRAMRHYFRDFDRMMYQDMRQTREMMDQPLWMPGPVIETPHAKPESIKKSSHKQKIAV
jgi:hypothetical protein